MADGARQLRTCLVDEFRQRSVVAAGQELLPGVSHLGCVRAERAWVLFALPLNQKIEVALAGYVE